MPKLITQETLKNILDYDPESGIFTWKLHRGRVSTGKIAGSLHHSGYIQIGIKGKVYFAQRLAWLYCHGKFPDGDTDHIDSNKTNNRIANLRDVTRSVNKQNRIAHQKGNTSGLLGVGLHACGKYRARIKINGKEINLGLFTTKEAAHAAYLEAKNKYHPTGVLK